MDRKWQEALAARDDGDVMPEAVPYLSLGSGMKPSWGWPGEAPLEPPDDHPERVIVWGLAALAFWIAFAVGLYAWLRWG